MAMLEDDIFSPHATRSRPPFGGAQARGKVIDQDGRELGDGLLHPQFQGFQGAFQDGFRFDFRNSTANPFGNLTREERLARLEMIAKLLDVAFVVPGTNVRYGIDGLIGLIPVIGDLITTAISLWLVREARLLGAPWHITARMLANVAVDGVVGMVPVAGDAFDVMFRANIRNVRMLRRWLDKQPRI
ncbi:DUF4112 domain-containing protein [Bradyrhizobium sp. Pha-3]|uniref:DUF4112 domain-containing protein n=1 Tax=Bradyrhizobium sp. Pha-3 TaxID=208375 RepID=UPI0035D47EED